MEALFSTTLATYEAWLMVLCVIVFFGIYLFDGIDFLQRVYAALKPSKPIDTVVKSDNQEAIAEVTSPILEPIAPEEIEAHEAEKIKAEEKHEQEVIESEEFEEKVLEEIQQNEQAQQLIKEESGVEESKDINDAVKDTEDIAVEAVVEPITQEKEIIEEDPIVENNPTIETIDISISETDLNQDQSTTSTSDSDDELSTSEGENTSVEEGVIDDTESVSTIIEEGQEKSSEVLQSNSDGYSEKEEEDTNPVQFSTDITEEPTDTHIDQPITDTTSLEGIIESIPTSEEPHTVPITASIPEPIPETRKSAESQHTERLYHITNEVKTLLARGHAHEARALIIEGLSLDKNHRELNLILGSIYESERQAQKAEYIYKDLALIYPEDGEILERLANILIIEKRYDLALEIYKKIISLSGETEGSLYIMTHLAHELRHDEELYAYARRYQKNWPNNPDILTLLSKAEIALGERQAAIQTLIKLKNLTPYNAEIMETIAKLTMEEELAGNFASRDNSDKS